MKYHKTIAILALTILVIAASIYWFSIQFKFHLIKEGTTPIPHTNFSIRTTKNQDRSYPGFDPVLNYWIFNNSNTENGDIISSSSKAYWATFQYKNKMYLITKSINTGNADGYHYQIDLLYGNTITNKKPNIGYASIVDAPVCDDPQLVNNYLAFESCAYHIKWRVYLD